MEEGQGINLGQQADQLGIFRALWTKISLNAIVQAGSSRSSRRILVKDSCIALKEWKGHFQGRLIVWMLGGLMWKGFWHSQEKMTGRVSLGATHSLTVRIFFGAAALQRWNAPPYLPVLCNDSLGLCWQAWNAGFVWPCIFGSFQHHPHQQLWKCGTRCNP